MKITKIYKFQYWITQLFVFTEVWPHFISHPNMYKNILLIYLLVNFCVFKGILIFSEIYIFEFFKNTYFPWPFSCGLGQFLLICDLFVEKTDQHWCIECKERVVSTHLEFLWVFKMKLELKKSKLCIFKKSLFTY